MQVLSVAAITSTLFYAWFSLLKPPLFSLQQHLLRTTTTQASASCFDRDPPIWPKSLIVVQQRVPDADSKVGPAKTITYYDYEAGGNLIQIFPQEEQDGTTNDDKVLWDLELNSGHSYYFNPSQQTCRPMKFPVGILRPNWLEGATPLGPSTSWDGSGRTVCGWTKVDFIDYYVDATTGVPDSWYFHTMKASFQVLEYRENPVIDASLFTPPEYCL
ncbi:expressed unknown protein [Seminavis robusta]|uniref:Uncharacterized protein n=1 Tax=Seminavis robusta TaxID=568900 RepID=A0A9N8EAT0_9STRA|nr:expressed unknown protein [Seminavis robusta]|eukprot:Sro818_g206950.1 n/a (216) ;mRNA; f:25460-26107